jgi:nucleotide-binding universal stress UspA family protein
MTSRVLVAVDGSAESQLAFTHAIARFPDAHIVILHVIEPFADHTKAGGHTGSRSEQAFERGQQLLDETVERNTEHAGMISTELIYGRPVHVIPRYIETNGIDEIVIGSRGRDGTARLLLGSVAETVVRRVPVPVTVVRSKDEGIIDEYHSSEHVLVPFDRSFCSRNALEYAFEQFPDVTVTALFVKSPLFDVYEDVESQDDFDEIAVEEERTEQETDKVFEMARKIAGRKNQDVATATAEGDPSRGILTWVDENDVDHVVIGCHGRDGVSRWLLGSVAETVVRRAPVPVTAVK